MIAFLIAFAFLTIASLTFLFLIGGLKTIAEDLEKTIKESDDEQNRF